MVRGVDLEFSGLPDPTVDESQIEPRTEVVVLPDELDLATSSWALSEIRRCMAGRPGRLIADMSATRFLGAVGISALLEARDEAQRAGVRFQLACVGENRLVHRALTITGLIELFDLAEPRPGSN
jgi:anti-anti-sigma factor